MLANSLRTVTKRNIASPITTIAFRMPILFESKVSTDFARLGITTGGEDLRNAFPIQDLVEPPRGGSWADFGSPAVTRTNSSPLEGDKVQIAELRPAIAVSSCRPG